MFMYKRLVESGVTHLDIQIFEKGDRLGSGMPYSPQGAGDEHITNVSANETPELVTSIKEWIRSVPKGVLGKYRIDADNFNEYKTLPRLLFGRYLADQFKQLIRASKAQNITTKICFNSEVTDIIDDPEQCVSGVVVNGGEPVLFDKLIICTGHYWPEKQEGSVPGYFDCPYPPAKLQQRINHAVAIRGSSLTAVDAIRTLSRSNGKFSKNKNGSLSYKRDSDSNAFRIVMHSRNGLLPALRFHLEDFNPAKNAVLTAGEMATIRETNDGFIPLDYIFERNFKAGICKNDPDFYEEIKDLSIESFVERMMELRERVDAFDLLEAECAEADKSIKRRKSIHWKELLGELSFALSSPAKYFSAEDMIRLRRVLMPLISVVIAYLPQSSAGEMLALHHAGCLDVVPVGDDSEVEPQQSGGIIYNYTDESGNRCSEPYETFVDGIGQPALAFNELPFKSLIEAETISPARLYFRDSTEAETEIQKSNPKVKTDRDGRHYLIVPGIAINDNFQAVDAYNAFNDRIYVMAVPFIGGFNPDYSGLDFCESASRVIARSLLSSLD